MLVFISERGEESSVQKALKLMTKRQVAKRKLFSIMFVSIHNLFENGTMFAHIIIKDLECITPIETNDQYVT